MVKRFRDNGLKEYLELESMFSSFFSRLDYCRPACLDVGIPGPGEPGVGCCNASFHRAHSSEEELSFWQERISLYGMPIQREMPCGYHTSEGCKLKSHRPAVCISYACTELTEHIRKNFDIHYDPHSAANKLKRILIGKSSPLEIEILRYKLEDMLIRLW